MTEAPLARTRAPRSGGASVLMYRVGGREYPLKTEAQCLVCNSPYRFHIEQEIVSGRTYKSIVDSIKLQDGEFSIQTHNIKAHYEANHMPLQEAATRAILERRAQARGASIDAGIENLVDGLAVAEIVVQKGYEAIASGELKPDMTDVLRAVKLLEDYEGDGSVDMDLMVDAFMIYHETAQRFMTPQSFQEYGRELAKNPVLAALIDRFEGNQHQTVQGEVSAG